MRLKSHKVGPSPNHLPAATSAIIERIVNYLRTNWLSSVWVMAIDLPFPPLQMARRPRRQMLKWDSMGGSLAEI